ncbi:MAG: M56 family metallopeptidase [Deltaproteobacteria bacterium]|nr:M56 family metallopeptidase [Deltaproteobacteria bacterium]
MTMFHGMDTLLPLSALLTWQAKAAAVLLVTLAGSWALRRTSARVRRTVWAAGLLGAVLVPLAGILLESTVGVPATASIELPSLALALDATAAPTTAASASTANTVAVAPAASASAWASIPWSALVVGVWLLGTIVMVGHVVVGMVGGSSLCRRTTEPSPRLAALHRDACRNVGYWPALRLHARPTVPIVFGLRRPMIVLPMEAQRWSDDRVRAVLLHELGHVAHRDPAMYPLLALIRAPLWINPLAWLALGRFHREAEFAADDAAVGGGIRRSSYAAELLALAKIQLTVPHQAIPAPGLGHPQLGERIRRVLSSQVTLVTLRHIVPVMLGAVGALVAVALVHTPHPLPDQLATDVPNASNAWVTQDDGPTLRLPVVAATTATTALGSRSRITLSRDALEVQLDGVRTDLRIALERGRLPASMVDNHLVGALYNALEPHPPEPDDSLVLLADPNADWATIVDILYTAGRAQRAHYALGVRVGDEIRAIEITPPMFSAHTSVDPHPILQVQWSNDGRVLVEGRYSPTTNSAQLGAPCALPVDETETLAAVAVAACEWSQGRPLPLWIVPAAQTRLGEVVDVMAAMPRPCGGHIVVTSGDPGTAERAPTCSASTFVGP